MKTESIANIFEMLMTLKFDTKCIPFIDLHKFKLLNRHWIWLHFPRRYVCKNTYRLKCMMLSFNIRKTINISYLTGDNGRSSRENRKLSICARMQTILHIPFRSASKVELPKSYSYNVVHMASKWSSFDRWTLWLKTIRLFRFRWMLKWQS